MNLDMKLRDLKMENLELREQLRRETVSHAATLSELKNYVVGRYYIRPGYDTGATRDVRLQEIEVQLQQLRKTANALRPVVWPNQLHGEWK